MGLLPGFQISIQPAAGWTRILSEQVSADENRKFFGVLSCPMVSWPPVFTLAGSNSAPRCLKKMATAKTFHVEKDTCCTLQCAQRRHEPTMPGTGKHTNLMGGGSYAKNLFRRCIGPQRMQFNHRISMVKLHIFDCNTISYMIWNTLDVWT